MEHGTVIGLAKTPMVEGGREAPPSYGVRVPDIDYYPRWKGVCSIGKPSTAKPCCCCYFIFSYSPLEFTSWRNDVSSADRQHKALFLLCCRGRTWNYTAACCCCTQGWVRFLLSPVHQKQLQPCNTYKSKSRNSQLVFFRRSFFKRLGILL